jgi:hypothetical protein
LLLAAGDQREQVLLASHRSPPGPLRPGENEAPVIVERKAAELGCLAREEADAAAVGERQAFRPEVVILAEGRGKVVPLELRHGVRLAAPLRRPLRVGDEVVEHQIEPRPVLFQARLEA